MPFCHSARATLPNASTRIVIAAGPRHIPRGPFRPEENIFLVCGHTESIREFLMNEKFPMNLKNSLPLPEEFPNTVNPAFQNRS